MKKETRVWLDLAEEDYRDAELLWKNHRYGATVFFSQQAAEKILKALVVETQNKLPAKTHKIEMLVREAGLSLDEIENPDVSELSKAYIRVRYPDLNKKYYTKREKVEPLFKMAQGVYKWVKGKLENP